MTSSRLPITLAILFLILVAIKSPSLLIDPRFWAEEGTEYYSKIINLPGVQGLFISVRGSFQLFTNALVWLSTFAPLSRAPFVTTYGTLILHTIVAWQLALFVLVYRLPKLSAILLVVAWTFLPSTYEVWLTATNVQWVAGCSMLLLTLMPVDWLQKHRVGCVAWTLACCLSGIPSILVGPVFGFRYLSEGRRPIFLSYVVAIFLCAVIEVIVLLNGGSVAREFPLSITILTIPTLLQTIVTPIYGYDLATDLLTNNLRLAIVAVSAPVAIFAFTAARTTEGRHIALAIAAAWITITTIQLFAGISPTDLLKYLNGSRYFMAGSLCLCLMLALGTASKKNTLRIFSFALLFSIAINGVYQRRVAIWPTPFLFGPSWAASINSCQPHSECVVTVWPGLKYPMSSFLPTSAQAP